MVVTVRQFRRGPTTTPPGPTPTVTSLSLRSRIRSSLRSGSSRSRPIRTSTPAWAILRLSRLAVVSAEYAGATVSIAAAVAAARIIFIIRFPFGLIAANDGTENRFQTRLRELQFFARPRALSQGGGLLDPYDRFSGLDMSDASGGRIAAAADDFYDCFRAVRCTGNQQPAGGLRVGEKLSAPLGKRQRQGHRVSVARPIAPGSAGYKALLHQLGRIGEERQIVRAHDEREL